MLLGEFIVIYGCLRQRMSLMNIKRFDIEGTVRLIYFGLELGMITKCLEEK